MEEIRTLLEEPTSQFLTNETEVTGITSEGREYEHEEVY